MSEQGSMGRARKEVAMAVDNVVRLAQRHELSEAPHVYTDLVGQDIFVAGHRFHMIGTLTNVELDWRGDPIAHLDMVHQISYDQEENIPQMYFLGNAVRFPISSLGWIVQPISGRPKGYQEAWATAKAARQGKSS